jgi:hypothetical protein
MQNIRSEAFMAANMQNTLHTYWINGLVEIISKKREL